MAGTAAAGAPAASGGDAGQGDGLDGLKRQMADSRAGDESTRQALLAMRDGGPDLGDLAASLDQLSGDGGHDQLRGALLALAGQSGSGGDVGDAGPADFAYPDGPGDPFGGDPFADDLAQVAQFAGEVHSQVREAVEPLQKELDQERLERDARDLTDELPAFGQDPDFAREILTMSNQYAETHFGDYPGIAESPKFWRLIAYANLGAQAANEENANPAPPTAILEGGGGARPASGGRTDAGDAIVNATAGRGAATLPFR